MAQFEGIQWGQKQIQYFLNDKKQRFLPADAQVFAVSRSIHYGLFLAFEGIRFFCKKNERGKLELTFLNWDRNLARFRRGIAFNLSRAQQAIVPTEAELETLFLNFFRDPIMQHFLADMAQTAAQGYLRPFTLDEEQSIGVTFPANPAIRAVVCRYDRYLGEPFSGVVVPNMVRAVGINQTGCLKLGVNYLISVKAVDFAKSILPEAAAALFLDDNPFQDLLARTVTEWDSSCCLFALRDQTVIKIPESNLILPSVTIGGIVNLLRARQIQVIERDLTYGELIELTKRNEIVAICSVGTAGILNRCQRLLMLDYEHNILAEYRPDTQAPLYQILGALKTDYWAIYQEKIPAPPGLHLQKYEF